MYASDGKTPKPPNAASKGSRPLSATAARSSPTRSSTRASSVSPRNFRVTWACLGVGEVETARVREQVLDRCHRLGETVEVDADEQSFAHIAEYARSTENPVPVNESRAGR